MHKPVPDAMLAAMAEHDAQRLIADLHTLLEVSRRLGATTELNPLLEQIMAAATNVLGCERATVFLYDQPRHELYSQLATGAEHIRFDAAKGIAGECLRTGKTVNVPDAYADTRFNREIDRITGFRTRNLLTFPLRSHDGRLVGALQALNKSDGPFGPREEELAQTLSSLAGVAVQRQLLIQEYTEKQKLERDLAVARNIQQSTLPRVVPAARGFDLAGFNEPADATGGDTYDYFALPDGRIVLTIADATGHGIGPALVVTQYRAMVRALLAVEVDVLAAMERVNTLLGGDIPEGMFVTGFLGILDPATGVITYVSAGHGPLLHHRRANDERIELSASTLPLGIMSPLGVDACDRVTLAPGDTFMLMTDGFFEWANAADEQFGTRRIFDVVAAHPQATAGELISHIRTALNAFAGAEPQRDDLTAVVVRRLGK